MLPDLAVCILPHVFVFYACFVLFAMLQNKGNPPCGRTPTVIATQTLSCVFSTSAEGNTPRGVPHRVQSNVDAAETPSDGLMPQSHLATLTSFPGAAHHMCTVLEMRFKKSSL